MSSVFAGYPVETKPPKPRKDLPSPGDPTAPLSGGYVFQFTLYRDINGVGAPSIVFAVGDNVDVAKQQSVHSTLGYLLSFMRENARLLSPPSGADRQAYILTLPVNSVKSQITVTPIGPNLTVQETDIDQDAVNLVFYVFGPDSPQDIRFGAGVFMATGKRLIELAREMDYSTVGQPRSLAPDVNDEVVAAGGTATFIPPTWNTTAPQTAPDILEWVENLVPFDPPQDGSADLVLTNVTADMDGRLYQVRAGYIKPGGTIPDAWKHSNAGLLTVT